MLGTATLVKYYVKKITTFKINVRNYLQVHNGSEGSRQNFGKR